jgi:hypothetical protein
MMKLRWVILLVVLVATAAYNLGYWRYQSLLNEYLQMPTSSYASSVSRL